MSNRILFTTYIIVAMLVFTITSVIETRAQVSGSDVYSYLTSVKAGNVLPIPSEFFAAENQGKVVEGLELFRSDTAVVVQRKVIEIVGTLVQSSIQQEVRSKAASLLVSQLRTNDARTLSQALHYLSAFRAGDFTPETVDSLASHIAISKSFLPDLFRIVGKLNLVSLQSKINRYSQPGNPQPVRWAALLALSRMNDQTATNSILTRVKKLPVNDDFVYEIFPDLIYTRQRAAFDYIIAELHNDKPNCTSADNDNPTPIPCGYRIMEMLAPVIKDYPLEVDATGDIKTKDYKKALETVRSWFKKKGDRYEIIMEGM